MRRTVWILLAIVLALIVVAAVLRQDPGRMAGRTAPPGGPGSSTRATAGAPPSTTVAPTPERPDAAVGRAAPVALERAREVLAAIEARGGGPPAGHVGGREFHNRERLLPSGRYREYDIHPRVPGQSRGPERLVVEQTTGRAYYTGDHYRTFVPLN
ncbi:MAG TPA: ribonuclease domain-containing protein [Methylomirabilota bacterium]|jgi:ribonuclease T1|nr:ribonuclease domain-containing protein [Methylomirabilota bacterium]